MENRLGEMSLGPIVPSKVSAQRGPLDTHRTSRSIPLVWNEGAFDRLYEKYSPTVYSVALRVLANQSDAEDVLQDVFLRIWSKPESLAVAQEKPRKWLEAISRNRAIDLLRRRNLSHEIPSPPSVNSFEAVESGLLLNRTRFLIRRLPSVHREAIEMAYYWELTHAEIAHRLKTPLGTIKTRIRTGMRAVSVSIRGESSTRC